MKKFVFSVKNCLSVLSFCCGVFFIASCTQKDVYDEGINGKEPVKMPDEYFDFTSKSECPVYVNYGKQGYKVLVEIYDENPVEIDKDGNQTKKTGLEPFFKTYTDNNSSYSGTMQLIGMPTTVYLYTEYLGLPACVPLDVTAEGLSFDMTQYGAAPAKNRNAIQKQGSIWDVHVAENLKSLCSWGQYGKPDDNAWYSLETNFDYSMYKRILSVLPPNKNNTQYAVTEENTNIKVTKAANVDLVFIGERASHQNVLGYYYYPTGKVPTKKEILTYAKYVILPNASIPGDAPYHKAGYGLDAAPVKGGEKIRLQYFGPDNNGEATDVFPEGVTIGWFIISYGFEPGTVDGNTGDIKQKGRYMYSNVSYQDGQSRCVALFDKSSQKIIMGFEDAADMDFTDVIFYVNANPIEAIINPDSPDIPVIDDGEIVVPNYNVVSEGIVAFEDLWPAQGDYDMNDVMVHYKSAITYNENNLITEIQDTITPLHDGAQYKSAFGYQFGVDASHIKNVVIECFDGAIRSSATTTPAGLESGQTKATIMIADNMREAKGKYVVTTTFVKPESPLSVLRPPYNPFIVIKGLSQSLRNEVHLPKYQPTSLVNMLLFGTLHDKSNPSISLYYVGSENYPFAIDIPATKDFLVPAEGQPIDESYPDFRKWVDSFGKTNVDWYLYPKEK